jgi:hypothetical protein
VARQLVIDSPTPGARFELRGGDDPSPLAVATTTGGRQVVPLREGPARAEYVLWFTILPPDNGRFRAEVGEVELQGTANVG